LISLANFNIGFIYQDENLAWLKWYITFKHYSKEEIEQCQNFKIFIVTILKVLIQGHQDKQQPSSNKLFTYKYQLIPSFP
jgi:hypothetical protein